MSEITLSCTGGTFLSYFKRNSNFSSLSQIPSSVYYLASDPNGDAETVKNQLADDSGMYSIDVGGAVFEFESNLSLQSNIIKSVKLCYDIAVTVSTSQSGNVLCPSNSGDYKFREQIGAYKRGGTMSSITLNSVGNPYGICEYENDLTVAVGTSVSSYHREIDITSSYKANFSGAVSRYVIATGFCRYNGGTYAVNGMTNLYAARYTDYDGYNTYREVAIDKSTICIKVTIAPDTPTQNGPVDSSFVKDEPITFSWNYSSPISSPQASATIEYKLKSVSTWTTATSSGSSTTWILSAGLPIGSYEWRVKVTDAGGETSDYSTTKDFLIVTQPVPTPTYPVDTGLAAYAPIAFAWTFNKPSSASAAEQASATLQYRARGSGIWIDQEVTGSSTAWTLSAGLPIGQYEWRVCVTNNYGETSSYCNIVYFQIVAQSAPTPVSPGDNITLFEGHDITFTWVYNSLTPATQESATIKYRVRGGSTWTTYTSTSSNPYCTISDIPQGQYEWCLNITNNYGETSADSGTLEFNIIGRPQKPIILEPDNCCLTTISWNAEGQEAAEFILMDGDDNILIHETVATAVTSYKPQMFLKGSYKAMARIKNNSDLWSDYGELEFDIDAAEPDPGNLIAMPFDTEIHLEGTYTSTNVAIVRIDEDGTETVLAMDDHAVDKKVAGGTEYAYVLRSWNTGGYIDTPAKVFDFKFEGAIFSTETEELHLDRSEQKFLAHGEEIERQYAQMRYVGREFAVIERGEYTEQTLSKQFHVTKAQRRILDRMAKEKSLFYRDSRGNAFKAAILNVSYSNYMDNDYIASIRLTRTAADEVIINV